MATHSTNFSHSTLIENSDISIENLNVNKTSTHQEIINSLPVYHAIDSSLFANSNTIALDPSVSIDHINSSMFFVNGVALTKVSDQNSLEEGYFLTADGVNLTITGFQNLSTMQIHALYTDHT